MPQFDPTTFSPQLFWLLLSFGVLFFAMWRSVLPRLSNILEARQERIDSDLEKAAALKSDADKVRGEYEAALAEARGQAAAAIKQAGEEMSGEAAKRHEAFGAKLARQTDEAEARIAAARDEALANIMVVAAETARAATAKLIDVDPPEDQVRVTVESVMKGRS